MQHALTYIRAATGCTLARNASHYVKRDGITYVAQSARALAILTGEYIPARANSGIPAGIMRRVDQFRTLARRIARERNCNSEIARAIARRQLRAN